MNTLLFIMLVLSALFSVNMLLLSLGLSSKKPAITFVLMLALLGAVSALDIKGMESFARKALGDSRDFSNNRLKLDNPFFDIPLSGEVTVIDGDTVVLHGPGASTTIRLHGIDAPESGQLCSIMGETSQCGRESTSALKSEISDREVTCHPKTTDRYDRVVAVCFVGGKDLSAYMVRSGWAMAYRKYSQDYVALENRAAAGKLGIWRGGFTAPWEYRKALKSHSR